MHTARQPLIHIVKQIEVTELYGEILLERFADVVALVRTISTYQCIGIRRKIRAVRGVNGMLDPAFRRSLRSRIKPDVYMLHAQMVCQSPGFIQQSIAGSNG